MMAPLFDGLITFCCKGQQRSIFDAHVEYSNIRLSNVESTDSLVHILQEHSHTNGIVLIGIFLQRLLIDYFIAQKRRLLHPSFVNLLMFMETWRGFRQYYLILLS